MAASPTKVHSILIVGGCGFISYHLVCYFSQDPSFSSVSVLSRSAASGKNHVKGVKYYSGDIADHDTMRRLLQEIKPTVIIHTVSPSPLTGTSAEYQNVSVTGTRNLLELGKQSPHVYALVYTLIWKAGTFVGLPVVPA